MTATAPLPGQQDAERPGGRGRALGVAGAALVGSALLAVTVLGRLWAQETPEGLVLSGTRAWLVVAGATGIALVLLVVGLTRRTSWHYPEGPGRDLRLDWVRGVAIVFVVLNHLNIPSLFQLVSQETIGPVSGAELFVALSGVVLGIVYRRRSRDLDMVGVVGALWSRAFTLYRTALVVVLGVFVLTLVPGVDGRVITTFTDQSTGQTYGLYPNVERLLDYPVPGYVLRDILLLRLGPYQFNILGLYVALLAVAPLLVLALRRGLVLVLLSLSWVLYLLNLAEPWTLLGSAFEDPFPLPNWQLLFVHGLAAGWYRDRLLSWARRWWGRCILAVLVLAHLALVFFSLSNPYLSNRYDVRLDLIPGAEFLQVYQAYFERRALGLGRAVDVALLLVTLYGLLTAYWKPLNAALGWFLVPLGQATLYVFVLHVFFALLVANVPGLTESRIGWNTVAHVVVLGLLWLMVRRRFLFSVVPR
jgi:hypothetical protein